MVHIIEPVQPQIEINNQRKIIVRTRIREIGDDGISVIPGPACSNNLHSWRNYKDKIFGGEFFPDIRVCEKCGLVQCLRDALKNEWIDVVVME